MYWVYRAEASDCESCPKRDACLCQSHKKQGRRILRNYFDADMHRAEALRTTPEYNDAMRKRHIWCEGTFAAQMRTRIQFYTNFAARLRGSGRPLPPFSNRIKPETNNT